jgi:two-component system NarL family sensor kinase
VPGDPLPEPGQKPGEIGWRQWWLIAAGTCLATVGAVWGPWRTEALHNFFFWPPSGIALGLALLYGWRGYSATLAGLAAGLAWMLAPEKAAFYFVADAAIVTPGWLLVRRAWAWAGAGSPRYEPGVRFFCILFLLGGVIPCGATSPLAWYLVERYHFPQLGFYQGFLSWWLGGCLSMVVFTPAVLLLQPSFRAGGVRSRRSLLLTLAQIVACICLAMLVMERDGTHPVLMVTALIALGGSIAARCGPAGMILGNLALLAAAVVAQARVPGLQTEAFLAARLNFHTILLETMVVSLLIAGGFYDYRRADRVLHGMAGRLLTAQDGERRRISADLHDGASQLIAGAAMRLQAALARLGETEPPPASVRADMAAAAKGLSGAIREMRRTIAGLRPEILDRSPFAAVLAAFCARAGKHSGATIKFHDETPALGEQLSLPAREHLYRLVQEAVANALRHGQADTVNVTLAALPERPGWLAVRIADNGKGFDTGSAAAAHEPQPGRLHLGLHTMAERMRLIRGTLQIDSRPGHGTLITASVPPGTTPSMTPRKTNM